MVSIALIEPKTPGNIGAVARCMKNFNFKDLILVNPKCDHNSKESLDRASHAKDILKKARTLSFKELLSEFDYVIGTSSIIGTDYNIPRSPVPLDKLKIKNSKTVMVFGREESGLNNREIIECDFIVTIPSSKSYPALNLSHAVAITLYELSKSSRDNKNNSQINPASKNDKDVLLTIIYNSLNKLDFITSKKRETQRKLWKRVVGKAFMTRREIFALCGYFRKIK